MNGIYAKLKEIVPEFEGSEPALLAPTSWIRTDPEHEAKGLNGTAVKVDRVG